MYFLTVLILTPTIFAVDPRHQPLPKKYFMSSTSRSVRGLLRHPSPNVTDLRLTTAR